MAQTFEWMQQAEGNIRNVLLDARPELLAAAGSVASETKPDGTPVTELDKKLEEKLRAALREFDPSVDFAGEESLGNNFASKKIWVVDPIDGTRLLINDKPGWASQIVLMEDGYPTMSVIYGFPEDEWYVAYAGRGAFLNGQPIHVSEQPLSRAQINFDPARAFESPESRAKAARLGDLPCGGFCRTITGARQVAKGELGGYVSIDGNGGPWDYAPRALLMQEAGARVTNLDGGPYDFLDPNFIAAAPNIYDAIFAAINPGKEAKDQTRCTWVDLSNDLYVKYHDEDWGVPKFDDRTLFEFLVLEGAQAGLSWLTILRKRENYRGADEGIIRNRLKIAAAINNARAFLKIQREFGSFSAYQWQFVGGVPKQNAWRTGKEVPAVTPEAEAFSKDLKRRGFGFVGPTTIYAHMQAIGMFNDHTVDCFRCAEVRALAA